MYEQLGTQKFWIAVVKSHWARERCPSVILVRDLLNSGSKKIILNLAEITYIDSAGIGELVSTYTTVVNNGGRLKLLNLTKKIHQLLTITKLLTVFETFDNEEAALESI